MDLSKYKSKEVEVGLMLPTSYSTVVEEEGGSRQERQESNFDNCIEGTCIEATKDSMVIEAQYRSKIYRYEVPAHSIGFVLTTALSDSGKLASERMKQLHKAPKVSKPQ